MCFSAVDALESTTASKAQSGSNTREISVIHYI